MKYRSTNGFSYFTVLSPSPKRRKRERLAYHARLAAASATHYFSNRFWIAAAISVWLVLALPHLAIAAYA